LSGLNILNWANLFLNIIDISVLGLYC
jgi:hypothetical protein